MRRSATPSVRISLTRTLLVTFLARDAKRRVCEVSSAWSSLGLTVAMMPVRALPPSEGCSRRVSLELR